MRVGSNWKTITAGHRLSWHEKCHRIHGHGFRVRILVEGEIDAEKGIVVDFKELGAALDEWHAELDHKFLAPQDAVLGLWNRDRLRFEVECPGSCGDTSEAYLIDSKYVIPKEDVVVMPMKEVSTENLAQYFLNYLFRKTWAQGKTVTVQVTENGDNIAEVSQAVPKSSQPAVWIPTCTLWNFNNNGCNPMPVPTYVWSTSNAAVPSFIYCFKCQSSGQLGTCECNK